jgi:hypothetical protein
MGRPVKDYWNWTEVVVPYTKDAWKLPTGNIAAEQFLYSQCGDAGHAILVTKEYPTPRQRHSYKLVTAYHYYIKDRALATAFALKFS